MFLLMLLKQFLKYIIINLLISSNLFQQVKILDIIAKIDEEDYNIKFAKEKTWTCILSDGTNYELKPNGNDEYVKYQDRLEYVELVKKARIHESDKQVLKYKHNLKKYS